MTKGKKIYFFILGNLFGIALTFLFFALIMDSISFNYNTQKVEINDGNILSSIKGSLNNLTGLGGGACEKYSKFEEVWRILSLQYFDKEKLDQEKAITNATKGFVNSLDDPYTTYFDKKENSSFHDSLKGESDFEGIGAVVSKKENGVLLEEVFKESPAFKAGLMPLDLVIQVDGEKTDSMTLSQAVSKMRGPKGTKVVLTIFRSSNNEVFDVEVTRDKIVLPSVSGKVYNLTGGNDIGYIEIASFGEETDRLFKQVINEITSKKLKGLIVDLRGNGGGFLQSAVSLSSYFIPEGEVVVSSKYRTYSPEEYKSEGYGNLQGLPVVILIDGMSASSSEIMALALKEQIGAKLIGKKTFGKGSIQTIHDMEDGSSIKYTIGKWYSPKGENIDKIGVLPDIEIDFDLDLYSENSIDNQLEKSKEVILEMIKQ